MRKPFIIANWKMNKNVHESVEFVKAIKEKLPANKEIGIAAQAVSLYNMKKVAGSSNLQIIAQNASAELEGPYTGEISMRSLADAGVTYVMLGHLERRRLFNENNDSINQQPSMLVLFQSFVRMKRWFKQKLTDKFIMYFAN